VSSLFSTCQIPDRRRRACGLFVSSCNEKTADFARGFSIFWEEVIGMILNFLYFTIKIERNKESVEERIAKNEREHYLEKRAEDFALKAAHWNTRI
jgi:hypothetical protein